MQLCHVCKVKGSMSEQMCISNLWLRLCTAQFGFWKASYAQGTSKHSIACSVVREVPDYIHS